MRNRWLIEWFDNSADPDRDVREVANSPEEAVEILQRLISDETVFEDGFGATIEEMPAWDAIFENETPSTRLVDLEEEISQECDNGTIKISRV